MLLTPYEDFNKLKNKSKNNNLNNHYNMPFTLLAHVFNISSSKTKIPSVILLLIVGWAVKQGTNTFRILVPDLTSILPILGTVGLILIVLEGSLELELNKSKFPFIGKTTLIAVIPMLLFSFGLAFAFQ